MLRQRETRFRLRPRYQRPSLDGADLTQGDPSGRFPRLRAIARWWPVGQYTLKAPLKFLLAAVTLRWRISLAEALALTQEDLDFHVRTPEFIQG
jgi:hypothetical protein